MHKEAEHAKKDDVVHGVDCHDLRQISLFVQATFAADTRLPRPQRIKE
jgi:hypothetical protein